MHPVERAEQLRKRRGVTMAHIARHCGHTVTWYRDIALRRRRVYLDDFIKIAEALDEDVRSFFTPSIERNA